jgi:hypothetical protein
MGMVTELFLFAHWISVPAVMPPGMVMKENEAVASNRMRLLFLDFMVKATYNKIELL